MPLNEQMTDKTVSVVDVLHPLFTALQIFGLQHFNTRFSKFRFSPPRVLVWSIYVLLEGTALMFFLTGVNQLRGNFNDVSTFYFCRTIFIFSGLVLLIQSLIKAKPMHRMLSALKQYPLSTQEAIDISKLCKRLVTLMACSATLRGIFSVISYFIVLPNCIGECWADAFHMRFILAFLEVSIYPKLLMFCLLFYLVTRFIKSQFDKHYQNFEEQSFEQNWHEYKQLCELVEALDAVFAFLLFYVFSASVLIICLSLFFLVSGNDLQEGLIAFGTYDYASLREIYYIFFAVRMLENVFLVCGLLYCTAVGAVQLNHKSRRVKRLLLELELHIEQESFTQFHQFLSKTQDESWGLTAGRLFLIEKATVIKVMSASFTLLVMWIRFNFSDKILSTKECVCPCAVNATQ